ncbi:MAG: hypothetical protein CME65_03020 [Halobacteriovoraceae bacterium]|nr:hypothetical protein [Halobacteriovoraceae bacterium]|tara:strand:- start:2928 stop:4865 length:1938 start_codon:yes stop_codon:yes gene_type:complete
MKFWPLFLVFLLIACTSNERKLASVPTNNLDNYCISLRGNGQRMAALWGALAKSVESYGFPRAISGGSSSTYSMFLLESMEMNPYLSRENRDLEGALLLKSMMGYIDYLLTTKLFRDLAILADDPNTFEEVERLQAQLARTNDLSGIRRIAGQLRLAWSVIFDSRKRRIARVFDHDDIKMLMSDEFFNQYASGADAEADFDRVQNDPNASAEDLRLAAQRYSEILTYRKDQFGLALQYFGNYNIQENANIFFRPGPLDFHGFAKLFNRAANFYAGRGFTEEIAQDFRSWISTCTPGSEGKQWGEIVSAKSQCKRMFDNMLEDFLEEQKAAELGYKREYYRVTSSRIRRHRDVPFSFPQRIDDLVAQGILTIPTTGVIMGDSAARFNQLKADFSRTTDPEFGRQFSASIDDLRIGYWGAPGVLNQIESNLSRPFQDSFGRRLDFRNDFKSQLFYPLYHAKWSEVFKTSPAEPSLTNIRPMPRREDMVSIGGWMDHLSGPVLKSAGCQRVVTITKGDGVGAFGGGMIKRILNLEYPSWEELGNLSRTGDPDDTSSIWSRFQNLANPNSSFNNGLRTADAIVCANYDLLEFGKDPMSAFFNDGYSAPLYLKAHVRNDFLNNHNFVSTINRSDRNNENPPYISCFPITE